MLYLRFPVTEAVHLNISEGNKQQYAQTFINDEQQYVQTFINDEQHCLTEHALVDFDDFSYTPNFVFGGGGN